MSVCATVCERGPGTERERRTHTYSQMILRVKEFIVTNHFEVYMNIDLAQVGLGILVFAKFGV